MNRTESKPRTHTIPAFVLWIVAVSAAVAMTSCATAGPHFQRSGNVSQIFESYQVLPEYDYYYSGNEYKPNALVAIRKDFRLETGKWIPVEMDKERLQAWMSRMTAQVGAEYNIEPNGAYIRDTDGTPIGMWYSVWRLSALQKTGDREIRIFDPMTVFPSTNRNPNGNDDREERIRVRD